MASSYGDRYGREGPSELQKLYGSNLPPSLRYGAVRQSRAPRSQEPQNQGTPPVNEKTTTSVPDVVKRADDYKKSRARSEPVSTPNVHVPKARKSAPQKSSRPILQIKDIPEYADYPGGKYAFRDEDNVSASEPQLAYYRKRPRDPHAMKQKVVGVLRHGLKEEQSDNLKRQAAATTFLERINAKKEQRRHQATVVDAESEKEDAQPDSEAGKRQDLEDEEPTLGSPEPVPSADVAQSIKALESELEELKFQREMSRRLRDLGYTEQTIEIMVDKDKMNKFKADVNRSDRPSNYTQPPRAPVYPKVHKSYLAPETLRYYDLPWEYDRSDSDYIIILRDLSKSETDVLFEHTTRLRSGKLLFEPLERGRSKKTFSFHNREDRGASRKDVVVHRDRSKSGSETSSEDDSDIDDFIDDEIGRTFAWYETSDDLGILELGQDSAEDEPPAGLGSWFRKRKDVLQDVPQINAIGEEAPSHSRFRALALDEPDQAIEMTDTSKLDTHYPRPRGENSSASEKVIYSCYGKDWTGSSSESAGHPGLIVTSGMKDNHKDALYYLRHIRQDILDFHSYIEQVLEMSELRKVTRPLREHLKERGDPGGDPDAAHEDHMVAGAEADAESQAVVQETSAYQQYQGQGNGRNQDARQDAVNDDNEKEVLQQTIPQQSGEHEADLERSSSIAMPANQKEFQRQQAYSGDGSRSPSQSRASSASEVSEDDSDIFEVPKPFIDRAVLDALRLKYEEREGNYVVQKPVSMEQWKTVIAKSVNLTLEGIRMATQSSLLQHNNFDQKLLAASPSIEMNLYRPSKDAKKLSPDVDDIELYSQYQGISDDTFNQRVAALFDTPPNVDKSSTLAIGPTKAQPALRRMQVSQLCSILGYTALTQRDDTTAEDVELTPLDGSLYANLLNGLRSLLRFLASEESDDNKDEDWSKLLVSIVENLEVIDQTLQPEASAATIVILRKMCSGLHHLFRSLRDLELYSVTHQSLGSTDAGDLSECRRAMRHTVLALLRTAQASRGIARVVPVIESWEPHSARALSRGIVKQFFRTACSKSQWIGLQSSDLYVTGDTFQKQFSNYARRLSELGWSKEAAEFLLENGCSWKQAALHAKQAQSLLEKAFRGALASHPDRSIRWKAAAFPSDTIILLLPDILLRPVLDGQGALDMYYRYVTDLYSTILMGEPSRESLERIRHLRAELNAVSLLQTDQLKMLEQYAEAIFPQHKDGDPSEQFRIESDPHPGYRMLRALRKGIATQNDGIQELNNSLDNLQTEAQSQISGVQDWRDNAVVVFTIITIIFLPLSFISSVFGMNTADVRNMNHNQWVFWASAAPFTLAVIMITL
ncbi:hypothetical protein HII31_00572 [Pseudocercospora fuligena]|uniref:Uncharacterized protein n=1 Tax=Pseudocercospora fuligena TaxID=685502 RepID=A0A8H6RXX0_9PEZI|nr:hypothetical protein HII31_00572 [Pseudocercospora fuligena]